ncbi:MAG: SUMF1/EgtB/PvdO family nonheme iron enzyme [Verrucomicrobiota bacterium]|nr:SUMF1/EgtB/PvdO family nonheme iron enzyme [Verrucomicrobiota bacterium]
MRHAPRLTAILCLLTCVVATGRAKDAQGPVHLYLVGANPSAPAVSLAELRVASYYFSADQTRATRPEQRAGAHAYYRDIYPGIDLAVYGDSYELEYVFVLAPGADPALIRIAVDRPRVPTLDYSGAIRYETTDGQIVQNAPVVFVRLPDRKQRVAASYRLLPDGVVRLLLDQLHIDRRVNPNGTVLNRVPAGRQPGGPAYTFFASRFEVSNAQFVRFLNDAEASPRGPRGANLFFDPTGDVWINPDRRAGQDEAFALPASRFFDPASDVWINPDRRAGQDEAFVLSASRLTYDRTQPVGHRYACRRAADDLDHFRDCPVTGVSWLGAAKYCNWLTIESDRGNAERCYTEGANACDWAPVTATNWPAGVFGDLERELWLSFKGFRLPMINTPPAQVTTNAFNEYYKIAAWDGRTNRLYGFGRDTAELLDANFAFPKWRAGVELPVGFFDGENLLGQKQTRPNANFYGISDLSGNVEEWCNDFAQINDPGRRVIYGGSWMSPPAVLVTAAAAPPHSVHTFRGFRVVTTHYSDRALVVHVLFSFYGGALAGAPASTLPVDNSSPSIRGILYVPPTIIPSIPSIPYVPPTIPVHEISPSGL